MLGNSPFNFKTIEKIVAAFGWLFQDISIERINPDNGTVKTLKVPIEQTSKEKWAQRLISDPNAGDEATQKHVAVVLPRMGYELVNFRFDPTRKLPAIYYRVNKTDTNTVVKKQLNPVPILFYFNLYLETRTLSDSWNIIGQIAPFFHPDYTIPILDIPEMNLERDIMVTLVGNTHEDTYEGNFMDKRIISYEFNFEVKGHLYPVIKEKKIITTADIYAGDEPYVNAHLVPPTANIDEPFESSI